MAESTATSFSRKLEYQSFLLTMLYHNQFSWSFYTCSPLSWCFRIYFNFENAKLRVQIELKQREDIMSHQPCIRTKRLKLKNTRALCTSSHEEKMVTNFLLHFQLLMFLLFLVFTCHKLSFCFKKMALWFKKGVHISYLNRKLDFKIEINPKTSRQKPMPCERILIFEVLLFQFLKSVFYKGREKKWWILWGKRTSIVMTKFRTSALNYQN